MNPNIEGHRNPAEEPGHGPEVTTEEVRVQQRDGTPSMTHSLVRHLSDLSQEAATLVRGEIALARVEIDEKISKAQRGIVESLAGGAVLYAGILVLLAAAVFGLGTMIPLWLSALIIGLGTAIIGAIALGKGKHDLSTKGLKPDRMIDEGRKTREFAREQMP